VICVWELSVAAPPPPAAMFARLSASRAPRQAIGAFAGGALDTTIFSTCQDTMLSFFTTRTVLPLRAACKDARAAIALRGWEDVDTAILGSLSAWAACFPAARAGNAGGRLRKGAPPVTAEEWAALRALREPATGAPSLRELLLVGAGEGLVAAARSALPGVRIAAALAGECVARVKQEEWADISGLAVLDTGLLVSGGWGNSTLRLWNADTGECVGSMVGGGKGGKIAALPGGRFATAGSSDCSAAVFDAARRTRVCELKGHTHNVYCVASLPGGLVATGSCDGTVRLWTAATGVHVATLQHSAYALAMLPDGRLVSGGVGGIRLWDLSTRTCTAEWEVGHLVLSLAALEGGRLAIGCAEGAVHLWNTASGVREATLRENTDDVRSLAVLPRGLLASGSGSDDTVRVWSVAARACVAVLDTRTANVLAALPDGRLASGGLVDHGIGSGICVWELRLS
jgi:hypothetical protein